jgi:hypothetical protein
MTREELFKEINRKYNYCAEHEDLLENKNREDYNEVAKANLEFAFLNMGRLDDFTDDELEDFHENLMVTWCHLEDLGY